MAIAKVLLNNTAQMDTTQVTVTASDLASGITALGADGTLITGTASSGGDYTAQDWVDLSKPTGEIVSDVTFADSGSGGFVLFGRTGITKYTDMLSTGFPQQFFAYCSGLQYIVAPKAIFGRSTICGYCANLLGVDFLGEISGTYVFRNCTKLKHLVLRATTVQTLGSTNAFNSTPFASNGEGGTLWVPADLISSYQDSTNWNWATILGYTNNQIKSIESSATDPDAPANLTTHYVDGSVIPT